MLEQFHDIAYFTVLLIKVNDNKFVSAVSGSEYILIFIGDSSKHIGYSTQIAVTLNMTIAVIDILEVINVKNLHTDCAVVLEGAREGGFCKVIETGAVRQPCESIVLGL